MAKDWIAVAVGGMLGSMARYALVVVFANLAAAWAPIATLAANLGGCLAIGALAQWSHQHGQSNHWLVIGARIGLLGGLTTFSSFALDIVKLWQSGRANSSIVIAVAHVALGICAVLLGASLVRNAEGVDL